MSWLLMGGDDVRAVHDVSMELPWFHGLDDAALEAALRSLDACAGDSTPAADVSASPSLEWLTHKQDTDFTVSVNPQAPLRVQLRFASADSDTNTSSHGREKAAPVPETRATRKKREMQELRDEVDELQSTLSKLQSDDSTPWMDKVLDVAWGGMVACQRSQLRRSQAENRKLRRAIIENDGMINQLQQLVKQHEARVSAARLCGMDPSQLLHGEGPSPQDITVLESLTQVLTPMHLRTDPVLSDPRLVKLSPSFTSTNVERGSDSLAIQRMDSRIVPFDFERTTDAVWRNQLDRISGRKTANIEELPDGTLRSRYSSYMRVAGLEGYATCYMALRRIIEPDRLVIVRSTFIVYMGDGEKDHDVDANAKGLVSRDSPVRHFLWTTVSKPSGSQLGGGDSDPAPLTQIQSCGITLPTVAGQPEGEMMAMSKLYSEVARQMHLQGEEKVDNFLFESESPVAASTSPINVAVASC